MKKLLLSLSLILTVIFGSKAGTVDIDYTKLYSVDEVVTTVETNNSIVSVECGQGSHKNAAPKFYANGTALRMYAGNTMTISTVEGYAISEIVLNSPQNSYVVKATAKDKNGEVVGTLESNNNVCTWKGTSEIVILDITASCRVSTMTITYESTVEQKVKPVDITYSLDGLIGVVSLSCPTEGATVFYGFSYDAIDREYTEPFKVTERSKVYAQAKLGDDLSEPTELLINIPYSNFKDVVNNTENGDDILIKGNFEVLYQSGYDYLILTDGTSNILIYAPADKYEIGTKICAIEAKVTSYRSLFELTEAFLTEGGEGATYSPVNVASLSDLNYSDNLFDQVLIKECIISGKTTGKNGESATIELGEETVTLYNHFNCDFENGVGFDITGFVWRFDDTLQIVPMLISGGVAAETVKTPVISPDVHELKPEDLVSISCATPGAVIYYTLDDSEPTQQSTLYTEPFQFTESCTISARAFYEGDDKVMVPSEVATHTYHLFDPTCNIIDTGHEGGNASSYTQHTCTVDGVDYSMMGIHNKTQGIQMNNTSSRLCYIIQTSENEGYVVSSIEVDFNDNKKGITFAVRGANTPFTDSAENNNIKSNGVEIGTISNDNVKVEFPKDYKYFAFYPTKEGAVYMNSVTIYYREPKVEAPEAPQLVGHENCDVDEEERTIIAHEKLELSFEAEDGVEVYYLLGEVPFAFASEDGTNENDENIENPDEDEPQYVKYTEPIVIEKNGTYGFEYFAYDPTTKLESEHQSYAVVVMISEPEAPEVPKLKGLEDLDEDNVMYDSEDEMTTVLSDVALTLSFEEKDGIEIYYILGETPLQGLSTEDGVLDDEELDPMFEPKLYTESIVLDKNGYYGFEFYAYDPATKLESEHQKYMIVMMIPDPVAPEVPEHSFIGGIADNGFINSEDEVEVCFVAVKGVDIYYKLEEKSAPMKVALADEVEEGDVCANSSEHEGFVKHDGKNIVLTNNHGAFSFFACAPKTGLHSEVTTYTLDVATGILNIDADDQDAMYFNVDGVRINRPDRGVYLRITNGKVEKIVK